MVFDDVLAELAERRAEFREQRYVPRDFIARLKETGIYRAAAPARFGGEPLPPAEFLDRIERISVVDGSTGWVASFGSGLVYLAALPEDTQAELYRDGPDVVFAGGLFPVQQARPTARGFVVDGRWKYASGCVGADVLGVGIQSGTAGKPRVALLPPDQVEIVRDWDVVGMVGTGSFDLVVREVEVPREWTFVRGGASTIDEPLYRYPTIAYAAQVLAVVGAGVARAALDYAAAAGAGYTGVTGAPALADRPYYRAEVAACEAALRSARAWFYELSHEVWDTVMTGDDVSDEQNAHLRLAAAHLAKTSSEVAGRLLEVSGTAPINTGHPLQLLFGDALVPKQHAFLGPAMYDAAGAVLMGLPPTAPGFR
ncbi:acyl-CoA dehydrogenase family protein [Lentzea sp. NPDC005914]|uniref:acyl-CoA dehydrogenase family protein n=1 Tax=Lentzea sp. NPDC005914 TaxID=3154572 RepID=UPI0033F2226F